jgi:arylsulfatase A-like enzyme
MRRPTISRRNFLGVAAAAAAGSALMPWALSRGKRNVILIISDSMRRDALGCYDDKWVSTPNLDAFARSAVRCTNAFVSSFPTVLARNDILTGKYTFTYKGWAPIDATAITIPHVLRAQGIHTALIADTPHPYHTDFGYHKGFQTQIIIRGQANDKYVPPGSVSVRLPCDPKKLWEPREDITQYLRNIAGRGGEEDRFCARTMRTAAGWLQRNHHRQPFFLCVDTFDPHEPWDAPREYVDMYDPDYDGEEVIAPRYEQWRRFLTPAELRHCRALYAAEATMVDHWVGHLLAKIEKLGLNDNTLIVFVADHGVALGEHGLIGKGVIRNRIPQGTPLYPELCRIPLLARFPGCRPGATIDALAQPVNLARTIFDYFGVFAPGCFSAPSIWPVLQGREEKAVDFATSAPNLSPPLKRKVPHPTDRATITDGRWLLVYSCAGWGDELMKHRHQPSYRDRRRAPLTGEWLNPEIYDLANDPECLTNVYSNEKERAQAMHREFVAFLEKSPMRRDHVPYFRKLENS